MAKSHLANHSQWMLCPGYDQKETRLQLLEHRVVSTYMQLIMMWLFTVWSWLPNEYELRGLKSCPISFRCVKTLYMKGLTLTHSLYTSFQIFEYVDWHLSTRRANVHGANIVIRIQIYPIARYNYSRLQYVLYSTYCKWIRLSWILWSVVCSWRFDPLGKLWISRAALAACSVWQ